MAKKTIDYLKGKFKEDDFPSEQDFIDVFDSYVHIDDPNIIYLKNGKTEYNSDTEATGTGGLSLGEYYTAGDEHEDGVRQGSLCKINFV